MKQLSYIKVDPTKNITLLVSTPVPRKAQAGAAAKLMALMPDCEQVGFIRPSRDCDAGLRMMGGEFCGNASMSLAAVLASRRGRGGDFTLKVSGADKPVKVYITKKPGEGYVGRVSMPLPLSIEEMCFGGYRADVVSFPGIAHAIVTGPMTPELAEKLIRGWSGKVGADAFGMMLLDLSAGKLTPIVYVRSTDTVVRESSCASGTAAAAALMAARNGFAALTLREPGGTLYAEGYASGGGVTRLLLNGDVRMLGSGTVDIM